MKNRLRAVMPRLAWQSAGKLAILAFCLIRPSISPGIEADPQFTSISYPAGEHEIEALALTGNHIKISGEGRGVTILHVPDGIRLEGADPIVRDLTLIGKGEGIGLNLVNSWSALVENVEIENFGIGLQMELNDDARERAGGRTQFHWPSAAKKGSWGSRITLSEIRALQLTGPGDGVVLVNRLPGGNDGVRGEFFTATSFFGGHIKVEGIALVLKGQIWGTHLFGTYIDVGKNHGVVMDKVSRTLKLIGVSLDLSSKKQQTFGNSRIAVFGSARQKNIEILGTNITRQQIRKLDADQHGEVLGRY